MLRRTRDLQEFSFEQYDETVRAHRHLCIVYSTPLSYHSQRTTYCCTMFCTQGKLSVIVMVSGWLEVADGYKKTFGVLGEADQLSMNVRVLHRC